jgi:hypothetical protein
LPATVCDTLRHMKLSIREAGFETGVHRATLHRWLKSGRLLRDGQGKVDTRTILKVKTERKTGRRAGAAYPDYVRGDLKDFGITIWRALYLLAGAVRALSPERRHWVCEKFLPQFANEEGLTKLLEENMPPVDEPAVQGVRKKAKKKADAEETRPQGRFEDLLRSSESRKVKEKANPKEAPQGRFEDLLQSSKTHNPNPFKRESKALKKALVEPKQ